MYKAITWLSFFAIALTLACRDRDSRSPKVSQRLGPKWGLISWTESPASLNALSKDAFQTLAKRILAKRLGSEAHNCRITLEGALEVKDGEGALILSARIKVNDLNEPIKTGVAATGGVRDNASAKTIVESGLVDLAHALHGLLQLVAANPDRLIRTLDSAEPDEQVLALQLLAQKRVTKAVSVIGRLLTDPREQVVEAAADALVEIGDEQAVPLLIKSVRRGDLRGEVRAIEAMGRIGGKEAEAYLEMTAIGHEISEVRRLSESFLKRLRAQ